jgi:hypothetical protein
MKYEYKIFTLNDNGTRLKKQYFEKLQTEFDDGWEYVDSVQQAAYEWTVVGVVLRKEINEYKLS